MITRLPAMICNISSPSRSFSKSAVRCTQHIKSRPTTTTPYYLQQKCRRYLASSAINSNKALDLRSQLPTGNELPLPTESPLAPRPKRSLRPYIYASIFFLVGLIPGTYIRFVLAPPAPPLPGSPEDLMLIAHIQKQASKLPLVESLSSDPAWTHHDAYTSIPDTERSKRLTTGPLAGARALGGYQRIFTNAETGEVISVIWFGGAIAGWPGVTHGGVIATILDECLGRCAIRQFEAKTGVTANMELNYLKPVVTNCFYVIRAFPEQDGKTDKKCWVGARLETLEGRVCVEGKALYVVPKHYATRRIEGGF